MAVLVYTLLRVALFAGVYLVLALIGFRGWILVIGALVIAALLAYLVLPRQANAAAGVIEEKVSDREGRIDRSIAVDEDVEDALLDDSPQQRGTEAPEAPEPVEEPPEPRDEGERRANH